ncbi:MAG: MMPL family transporter [Marinobacter sp.]|uniref:MMPL family transporter n=1 Tax=Marinobacter sp. TaxID=50741 RepID=UPI003F9A8251
MIVRGRSRRWPALLWALVLGLLVVQMLPRLSSSAFDTSILALLPQDQQEPLVERASQRMNSFVANRVLLLIGGSNADRDQLGALAGQVAGSLSDSGAFTSVTAGASVGWLSEMTTVYEPYRYQLLAESATKKLMSGQGDVLVSRAARELVSPIGRPRPASIVDDPINLLGIWLENLTPATGFMVDEQGLYARDGDRHYRVITASFAGDPFAPASQNSVLDAVQTAEALVQKNRVSSEFLRSGLAFHAAAGAEQAKGELSTIGVGSLVAIVVLLLWQFRFLTYLWLPVISIGTGLVVALSASLMVFGQVHLVTLAFGASLVGVSVDYAFHYLCQVRYSRTDGIRRILPGITLGLVSSCLAYGAQALTPFPGLQQIALFSAAGLIGAWLTVVLWFPLARPWLSVSETAGQLGQWLQALARFRTWLAALLVAAVIGALWGLPAIHFDDSLRALQSSPDALIVQEQRVQQLSQNPGSARFLLVEGDSLQQVLEREERIRVALDHLVSDGQLQGYQAISGFVPSIRQQQRNRQLVQSGVYDAGLPTQLFGVLGMPANLVTLSEQAFAGHHPGWLVPDDLHKTPVADLLNALWLEPSLPGALTASLITLGGAADAGVHDELAALAGGLEGVRFVDRVGQISALLGNYRITVSLWMALAYGLVMLVLVVRYGRHCWRVILPPALATVVTLGMLAAFGEPLNLFNLLAALLILGIGLDIGIFVRESNGELHAWEAVTLSAITSLLAFGLLALSKTPVLHHFGITVLPGIGLAWLIAFVLHRREQN